MHLNGGIRYMHQKSWTSKQNLVYFGSIVHVCFAFCHIIKSSLKIILLQYFFKLPVLFSFDTCYDKFYTKIKYHLHNDNNRTWLFHSRVPLTQLLPNYLQHILTTGGDPSLCTSWAGTIKTMLLNLSTPCP